MAFVMCKHISNPHPVPARSRSKLQTDRGISLLILDLDLSLDPPHSRTGGRRNALCGPPMVKGSSPPAGTGWQPPGALEIPAIGAPEEPAFDNAPPMVTGLDMELLPSSEGELAAASTTVDSLNASSWAARRTDLERVRPQPALATRSGPPRERASWPCRRWRNDFAATAPPFSHPARLSPLWHATTPPSPPPARLPPRRRATAPVGTPPAVLTPAACSQAGILGEHPKVLWVGNIPEASATESAIRLLFNSYGDIRRVYLRRKPSPGKSWCLLMFRASESSQAALDGEPPVVLDTDGNCNPLIVEPPDIERALTKANPGALGAVVSQALDDDLSVSPTTESGGRPTRSTVRRRSTAEMEIRNSVTSDQTVELVSALDKDTGVKRAQWTKMRSSRVRTKLAVAAMFVQDDDANEVAAKAAIRETMVRVLF